MRDGRCGIGARAAPAITGKVSRRAPHDAAAVALTEKQE